MNEHPIQGLMDTTLQHIRQMVDANTIIGDQIVTNDGTIIIPVSKVSAGFASGGSDFGKNPQRTMFGGGGGAGVSINPVAFICVSNGEVKLLQINSNNTPGDKAVSMIPELFDKVTSLFKKDKSKKNEKDDKKQELEAEAAVAEAADDGIL